MGKVRNSYRILAGKYVKRKCEIPRLRREDNIKTHIKELGCKNMSCLNWLRIWPSEQNDKNSGCVTFEKFLDHVGKYQFLKKDSPP
jgi:hypothetical protein